MAERRFDVFLKELLFRSADARIPELFQKHQGALYATANRAGISVVALETKSLSPEQLEAILVYRLAQYVLCQQVDGQIAYASGVAQEPMTGVSSTDIHILAGSAEAGEILCYATLRSNPEATAGATMGTRARIPFPVEQTFGGGIYDGLPLLSAIPAAQVRELGRFVKNHQRTTQDALSVRAPIEVCLAVYRLLRGPLNQQVQAVIGDLEEKVAKRNLDFFHVPVVLVRGTKPRITPHSYLAQRFSSRQCFPFAFLVADLERIEARIMAIDTALEKRDTAAIRALVSLKKERHHCVSGLVGHECSKSAS
jgi:hypothetical protein